MKSRPSRGNLDWARMPRFLHPHGERGMPHILFKNARLVDPAAGLDGAFDLLVGEGRVARVGEGLAGREAAGAEVIDAAGLWIWPGLVDPHVHLREPGFPQKETLQTGGQAAAAGGYSSVVCEPNTEPPIDSAERAAELAERAAGRSPVRVYLKAAMTLGRRGGEPSDVAALAREAAVVALSDDGDPVVDPKVMEQVCCLAARHRMLLAPHCEDSPRALAAYEAGASPGFAPGPPYFNEAGYVERDLALAARRGARIHFSHVSMARSVRAITEAGEHGGVEATFEATPHHLLLAREDYADGAAPTVNPPIRPAADRAALRGAVLTGQADAIASDHAPHTAADKAAGACGLVGLETTLGLVLTCLVGEERLRPADAVRLMSLAPARIFGVPGGTLAPGSPADLALIDPEAEWTVEPEAFLSKSRNTPFAGRRLCGRAVATYVAGRRVFSTPGFDARGTG